MDIKPVSNYSPPKYPQRDVFIWHPELLSRHAPASWKANAAVYAALMAFVAGGCSKSGPPESASGTSSHELVKVPVKTDAEMAVNESESTPPVQQDGRAKVLQTGKPFISPIFVHGEGRGGIGCVVVSPAIFLSEEEAIQIIVEEFKNENIVFDKDSFEIKNGTYEIKKNPNDHRGGGDVKDPLVFPAVLDKYDSVNNFGFQYVSARDSRVYNPFPEGVWSSVTSFCTFDVARDLNENVKGQGNTNLAFFYEPIFHVPRDRAVKVDPSAKDAPKEPKVDNETVAKDNLRAQVRDFIDWLKQQKYLVK